jgi:Flp pilus assembly protein TadG
MRAFRVLLADLSATAGVEMALVTPLLVILMFGSMELGNYFLDQHAVSKQVHDGARFASRLPLAASSAYNCPGTVYNDSGATTKIVNVTKTGSVDGTATGRFPSTFWAKCPSATDAVTVTLRCVDKALYSGVYTGLAGNIPVVKVSADVAYPSLFGLVGFNTSALCLRATSEAAVAGL